MIRAASVILEAISIACAAVAFHLPRGCAPEDNQAARTIGAGLWASAVILLAACAALAIMG
jgi:hypothetical protein